MEIKVIKNEKDYVEIELIAEEAGLANALVEILLEDSDVEFASFRQDHSQAANPVIMLRTKEGNALHTLKTAVKKLKKLSEDFKGALKDAKKPKK